MLVSVVEDVTEKGTRPGWIPRNLNVGHLDKFFFLLAALTAADLLGYVICASWYKRIRVDSSVRGRREVDADI